MDWSLFIGIITLQQVTRVPLSCRGQTSYMTEHEWEEIFQNDQHVYNDVRTVECVYRCRGAKQGGGGLGGSQPPLNFGWGG